MGKNAKDTRNAAYKQLEKELEREKRYNAVQRRDFNELKKEVEELRALKRMQPIFLDTTKKHAELNEFLQKRSLTNAWGMHVVDAAKLYINELEKQIYYDKNTDIHTTTIIYRHQKENELNDKCHFSSEIRSFHFATDSFDVENVYSAIISELLTFEDDCAFEGKLKIFLSDSLYTQLTNPTNSFNKPHKNPFSSISINRLLGYKINIVDSPGYIARFEYTP